MVYKSIDHGKLPLICLMLKHTALTDQKFRPFLSGLLRPPKMIHSGGHLPTMPGLFYTFLPDRLLHKHIHLSHQGKFFLSEFLSYMSGKYYPTGWKTAGLAEDAFLRTRHGHGFLKKFETKWSTNFKVHYK